MGTNIRPEIKSHQKYHISKHRYYELKHFCLQYNEWKIRYKEPVKSVSSSIFYMNKGPCHSVDPTGNLATEKAKLSEQMTLVESTAKACDNEIGNYIFKAVTEDLSFITLKTKYQIPCERKMYYDRYRRFFWLLDKER